MMSKWRGPCLRCVVQEGRPPFATECPSYGALLDFEDLDSALDDTALPSGYGHAKGVEFSLVYSGTFNPYPNSLRLERVGDADGTNGFASACGGMDDRDHDGTLGRMYLRCVSIANA